MLEFFDPDSHIEEPVDLWDSLAAAFGGRAPKVLQVEVPERPHRNAQWLIDGNLFPKPIGYGSNVHGSPPISSFAASKPVRLESQSLQDVEARIEDMLGMNVQHSVLFPTTLLQPLTQDPELEVALVAEYNNYMARKCQQSGGRIGWAAPVPMLDMRHAVSEVQRAKSLGASGIMVLGTAGDILLHDVRLRPLFDAVSRSELPLCVHIGWAHTSTLLSCPDVTTGFALVFDQSILQAIFSMLAGGILDEFPDLKVGIFEGGVGLMKAFIERLEHWYPVHTVQPWPSKRSPIETLRASHVYFSVEGDESELRSFIDVCGSDKLMVSADYPHVHFEGGGPLPAFSNVLSRNDLSDREKEKLTRDNAMAFFERP